MDYLIRAVLVSLVVAGQLIAGGLAVKSEKSDKETMNYACVAAVGASLLVAGPLIAGGLAAVGFTSAGITAGSAAVSWMSASVTYGVGGGIVAMFQSIGAAGISTVTNVAIAAVSAAGCKFATDD